MQWKNTSFDDGAALVDATDQLYMWVVEVKVKEWGGNKGKVRNFNNFCDCDKSLPWLHKSKYH